MKILKNSRLQLFIVLILGFLFRFYRLSDYLQFLGDEGRDVLVVKRMLVDHTLTLLGPTASVGGFYIGGLYYYFMLPFLWLSRLDPVGPAFMAALFGLGTIFLSYIFGKTFWNRRVGLLIAFLVTISPYMISISRFSWNPNPIPFFSLLTILCLYYSAKTNKIIFTLFAGISVGVLLELHYINLVFLPIFGLSILLLFPIKKAILNLFVGSVGILLGDSMFILFEIRHGFPNTRSAFEFLFRGSTVSPRSNNISSLFEDTTRMLYDSSFGFRGLGIKLLEIFSIGGFVFWISGQLKKRDSWPKIILLGVWFVGGIMGVAFYRGTLLPHYFSYLYPLPFIFLSLSIYLVLKNKYTLVIGAAVLIFLTYFELSQNYLSSPPNHLLEQTQEVDKIALGLTNAKPFNFALVTLTNSDHAYRYFLEIWNRPPITIENPQVDPQRKTVTDQLIAVCEQKDCAPLGNPLWEVAGFGRAEIERVVEGPAGIKVYKLIHYTGK